MDNLLNRWRLLSLRKVLYLPYVLSLKERLILSLALLGVLVGGATLLGRVYVSFTVPAPKVGGELREALFRPPLTINPVYASANDTDRDISRLVFSGLVTYNGFGEVINDLAESVHISEDGKIYTVKLKDNVRWHDGRAVTSDDVVFTIKTIQNPQYRSPVRANWQGVEAEKVSEKEVKFTLKAPYAPFIENLTVGILPKHLWETTSPEKAILNELNLKPVGSGPYKFSGFRQADDGRILTYTLKRNADFHREGPYLKKITFVFYERAEEALPDFKRAELDSLGPVSTETFPGLAGSRAQTIQADLPRIFGVFLNGKNFPPFSEKAVRQALSYALDREKIASSVGGGVNATDRPLPFSLLEDEGGEVSFKYDLSAAAGMLEKAGWKDKDGDGIREKELTVDKKKETVKLEFTLKTAEVAGLVKTAELVKDMLREAGIAVNIEILPFTELELSVIRPRDFQALLFGQVYGHEPDPFSFWHSSQSKDPGLNISLYANKDADALLEEARKTGDKAEQNEKYAEFSKIFMDDLPAVFLYHQSYLYVLAEDIKGIRLSSISLPSDRFNEINLWYRKTKRTFR